jgi:transposase
VLSYPPSVRVFVATEAADMRCSMDGLCARVTQFLGHDPYEGHLFVFRNRRGDRVKILVWDRGGFWVHYKRLEKGTFHFPAAPGRSVEVDAGVLALLLEGFDLKGVRRQARWSPRRSREGSPAAA